MTDREKAIVMAYTGYTMLTGDKLGLYYQYVQEKVGRPVMTHELAEKPMQETIRTLSKPDFVELCRTNNGPSVTTLEEVKELRYTPREVRNALMEYGQHDLSIKLGEVIKYDPVQVEDILIKGREATKPVIPHMVDWGIYECPKCKTRVDKTYNFCKHCGRVVKWDA